MKKLLAIIIIAAAFTGCATTGPSEFQQGCMIGSVNVISVMGRDVNEADLDNLSEMCEFIEFKHQKQQQKMIQERNRREFMDRRRNITPSNRCATDPSSCH